MAPAGNDSFYSSPPFQAYFQQSPQSLILKANAPHFTVLAVSNNYLELTHKQRIELLNKNLFEVFPGSQADANEQFSVQSSFKRVIETGTTDRLPVFKYEIPVPETGTLETFFWSNTNEPILDEEGKVAYIINTTANVTQQMLQEQALEKAKAQQEVLNQEQAINEGLKALNAELASTNSNLTTTRQSLQSLNSQLEEEVAQRSKDLNNSEARLRSVLEQAPLGFCILEGPDLVITYANDRMLRLWNKTPDSIGQAHAYIRMNTGSEAFLKTLDEVYATGIPYSGSEVKAYTHEGNKPSWGYFDFVYQPIKNEQGQTTAILAIVNDVTEAVLARKASTQMNEQFALAMEAANMGTWYIQPADMTLEYNTAVARLIGYTDSTPMTFEQAMRQVPEEYRQKLANRIQEAIDSKSHLDITYPQRRFSDGEVLWIRALGKVIEDKGNEHPVFTGIIMDITQQKKEEQRKNDFINMISHELKTPLTSLGAYTQILQEKALKAGDNFTAGMLEKSNRQIKRMNALVNGFLDVSRLESGKIQLHKTTFVMNDLIQEVIDEVAVVQPLHSIMLVPCPPVGVLADREKIGSIIVNLLSNAVKFSPFGHRDITIICEELKNTVQVSITDKGIGIPPEKQQKIFERFYRATNDTGMSGFGIGLYLCAEIIELHQGQIGVYSEVGKGSEFWFTLPVQGANT